MLWIHIFKTELSCNLTRRCFFRDENNIFWKIFIDQFKDGVEDATFGASLHFFGHSGLFFCLLGLYLESGSGYKTYGEPICVVNQLLFWKYSHIFFQVCLIWGLSYFLCLSGLFLGLGSGSKTFLGPACID